MIKNDIKKIINLHKNFLSCSKSEIKNYGIIILNRGLNSPPTLKIKDIWTLAI